MQTTGDTIMIIMVIMVMLDRTDIKGTHTVPKWDLPL